MRIMGRPRGLIAVLAGALLLTGCGAGPSQVGAAVIVGDRSTSIDQVQNLIDKAVREQPVAQQLASQHKADLLGREVVRQLVVHELITKAAKQEGLTVDETEVAKALQRDPLAGPAAPEAQDPSSAVGDVVSRVRDHREALTDNYLLQQLAVKYLPKMAITADFALPVVDREMTADAARARAVAVAKEVAADPAAARAVFTREKQANGTKSGSDKFVALQYAGTPLSALFGAPVGSVIAVQTSPSSVTGWAVLVVRQRETDKPQSVDQSVQPTPALLSAFGRSLLAPYLGQLDLRVNPRYGVWDVVSMDLAPNEAATKGVVLLPHGAATVQQ
ncbi:SurA N-terminal domain-containing protein [Amycolatopsis samaneae]|uniref:SurA N-terminal domain-containing protein n=1 Tax=Amycolatopsis samaneae TaxID=664691 RepID=A0ABW5GVZ5_9PSEU